LYVYSSDKSIAIARQIAIWMLQRAERKKEERKVQNKSSSIES